MTARVDSHQLFQYSFRRGGIILSYGLIWIIATLAGYLLMDRLFGTSDDLITTLVISVWSAALAGGLGGATAMLDRLYRNVSLERNFQDQSLLLYLVQPWSGLLVGILILLFITLPITLLVNLIAAPGASVDEIFASSSFIALQILLSWIAGFYQEIGLKKITRRLRSGTPEPSLPPRSSPSVEELSLFEAWHHQQQVRRWSFTWGIFILVYGVLCLGILLFSALLSVRLLPQFESSHHFASLLILAGWPVAVAGGLGGILSMLRNLYHHVSVERDFDRQHLISYLVQPLLGFVFGLILYLLLSSGFLTVNALRTNSDPSQVIEAPVLLMLQLVLGWIAGFRNQFIAGQLKRLIDRVISLLKLVGKLIHPKTLFSQERRSKVLGEIRGQSGSFKISPTATGPTSSQGETENLSDWFTQ